MPLLCGKQSRFIRYLLFILLIALLLTTCSIIKDGWMDDGGVYLCEECSKHHFYQLGDTCERCGGSIPVNPMKYCYPCAEELNDCMCCGIER